MSRSCGACAGAGCAQCGGGKGPAAPTAPGLVHAPPVVSGAKPALTGLGFNLASYIDENLQEKKKDEQTPQPSPSASRSTSVDSAVAPNRSMMSSPGGLLRQGSLAESRYQTSGMVGFGGGGDETGQGRAEELQSPIKSGQNNSEVAVRPSALSVNSPGPGGDGLSVHMRDLDDSVVVDESQRLHFEASMTGRGPFYQERQSVPVTPRTSEKDHKKLTQIIRQEMESAVGRLAEKSKPATKKSKAKDRSANVIKVGDRIVLHTSCKLAETENESDVPSRSVKTVAGIFAADGFMADFSCWLDGLVVDEYTESDEPRVVSGNGSKRYGRMVRKASTTLDLDNDGEDHMDDVDIDAIKLRNELKRLDASMFPNINDCIFEITATTRAESIQSHSLGANDADLCDLCSSDLISVGDSGYDYVGEENFKFCASCFEADLFPAGIEKVDFIRRRLSVTVPYHVTQERKQGQPIIYGSCIQLRHVASGKYLKVGERIANAKDHHMEVLLETRPSLHSWFQVVPALPSRGDGDSLGLNDAIYLMNYSWNRYIGVNLEGDKHPVPPRQHSGKAERMRIEIGGSVSNHLWKVMPEKMLDEGSPQPIVEERISFGDAIRLYDRNLSRFLVASLGTARENHQDRVFFTEGTEESFVDDCDPMSFWRILPVDVQSIGNATEYSQQYRILHIISEKFLAVKHYMNDGVEEKALTLVSVPNNEEENSLFSFVTVNSTAEKSGKVVTFGSLVLIRQTVAGTQNGFKHPNKLKLSEKYQFLGDQGEQMNAGDIMAAMEPPTETDNHVFMPLPVPESNLKDISRVLSGQRLLRAYYFRLRKMANEKSFESNMTKDIRLAKALAQLITMCSIDDQTDVLKRRGIPVHPRQNLMAKMEVVDLSFDILNLLLELDQCVFVYEVASMRKKRRRSSPPDSFRFDQDNVVQVLLLRFLVQVVRQNNDMKNDIREKDIELIYRLVGDGFGATAVLTEINRDCYQHLYSIPEKGLAQLKARLVNSAGWEDAETINLKDRMFRLMEAFCTCYDVPIELNQHSVLDLLLAEVRNIPQTKNDYFAVDCENEGMTQFVDVILDMLTALCAGGFRPGLEYVSKIGLHPNSTISFLSSCLPEKGATEDHVKKFNSPIASSLALMLVPTLIEGFLIPDSPSPVHALFKYDRHSKHGVWVTDILGIDDEGKWNSDTSILSLHSYIFSLRWKSLGAHSDKYRDNLNALKNLVRTGIARCLEEDATMDYTEYLLAMLNLLYELGRHGVYSCDFKSIVYGGDASDMSLKQFDEFLDEWKSIIGNMTTIMDVDFLNNAKKALNDEAQDAAIQILIDLKLKAIEIIGIYYDEMTHFRMKSTMKCDELGGLESQKHMSENDVIVEEDPADAQVRERLTELIKEQKESEILNSAFHLLTRQASQMGELLEFSREAHFMVTCESLQLLHTRLVDAIFDIDSNVGNMHDPKISIEKTNSILASFQTIQWFLDTGLLKEAASDSQTLPKQERRELLFSLNVHTVLIKVLKSPYPDGGAPRSPRKGEALHRFFSSCYFLLTSLATNCPLHGRILFEDFNLFLSHLNLKCGSSFLIMEILRDDYAVCSRVSERNVADVLDAITSEGHQDVYLEILETMAIVKSNPIAINQELIMRYLLKSWQTTLVLFNFRYPKGSKPRKPLRERLEDYYGHFNTMSRSEAAADRTMLELSAEDHAELLRHCMDDPIERYDSKAFHRYVYESYEGAFEQEESGYSEWASNLLYYHSQLLSLLARLASGAIYSIEAQCRAFFRLEDMLAIPCMQQDITKNLDVYLIVYKGSILRFITEVFLNRGTSDNDKDEESDILLEEFDTENGRGALRSIVTELSEISVNSMDALCSKKDIFDYLHQSIIPFVSSLIDNHDFLSVKNPIINEILDAVAVIKDKTHHLTAPEDDDEIAGTAAKVVMSKESEKNTMMRSLSQEMLGSVTERMDTVLKSRDDDVITPEDGGSEVRTTRPRQNRKLMGGPGYGGEKEKMELGLPDGMKERTASAMKMHLDAKFNDQIEDIDVEMLNIYQIMNGFSDLMSLQSIPSKREGAINSKSSLEVFLSQASQEEMTNLVREVFYDREEDYKTRVRTPGEINMKLLLRQMSSNSMRSTVMSFRIMQNILLLAKTEMVNPKKPHLRQPSPKELERVQNKFNSAGASKTVLRLIGKAKGRILEEAFAFARELLAGGNRSIQKSMYNYMKNTGDNSLCRTMSTRFTRGIREITDERLGQLDDRDSSDNLLGDHLKRTHTLTSYEEIFDASYVKETLKLLQSLTEGHYAPLQNYLRDQLNLNSYNLLQQTVEFLNVLEPVLDISMESLLHQGRIVIQDHLDDFKSPAVTGFVEKLEYLFDFDESGKVDYEFNRQLLRRVVRVTAGENLGLEGKKDYTELTKKLVLKMRRDVLGKTKSDSGNAGSARRRGLFQVLNFSKTKTTKVAPESGGDVPLQVVVADNHLTIGEGGGGGRKKNPIVTPMSVTAKKDAKPNHQAEEDKPPFEETMLRRRLLWRVPRSEAAKKAADHRESEFQVDFVYSKVLQSYLREYAGEYFIRTGSSVIQALVEYTQGPCKANQSMLVNNSNLCEIINKILGKDIDTVEPSVVDDLLQLKIDTAALLLALLEGQKDSSVINRIMGAVDFNSTINDHFRTVHRHYFVEEVFQDLAESSDEYEVKRYEKRFNDLAFKYAIIVKKTIDHFYDSKDMVNYYKFKAIYSEPWFEQLREEILDPQIARVEIIHKSPSGDEDLERVYFIKPRVYTTIWRKPIMREAKLHLLDHVKREDDEKLPDFYRRAKKLINKMKHLMLLNYPAVPNTWLSAGESVDNYELLMDGLRRKTGFKMRYKGLRKLLAAWESYARNLLVWLTLIINGIVIAVYVNPDTDARDNDTSPDFKYDSARIYLWVLASFHFILSCIRVAGYMITTGEINANTQMQNHMEMEKSLESIVEMDEMEEHSDEESERSDSDDESSDTDEPRLTRHLREYRSSRWASLDQLLLRSVWTRCLSTKGGSALHRVVNNVLHWLHPLGIFRTYVLYNRTSASSRIWYPYYMMSDITTLYHGFYLLFSLLGLVGSQYFFAYEFHLLDLIIYNKTARSVLRSVTNNTGQLLQTGLVAVLLIYLYATIGFLFFRNDYDENETFNCDTFWQCITTLGKSGVINGGGIAEAMAVIPFDSTEFYTRWVYDVTYFLFFVIILLNITAGIIIDSFGALRDEQKEIHLDTVGRCFICNRDKDVFERTKKGFNHHVKHDHNLWNYMFFILYLMERDRTEYTGQESYVAKLLFKAKPDFSFFPVDRAIILDEEEDEED